MKQRVLVTAGASGIGREIAQAFAANGATVFVCDVDGEGLDRLAQEIPDWSRRSATCPAARISSAWSLVVSTRWKAWTCS